jgi:predicted Zn-dependent protease
MASSLLDTPAPPAVPAASPESLFARALRYRVPQVLAVYVGAMWAILQLTNFAVARYALTDNIVDIVGTTLVLLVPPIMLLQWWRNSHGEQGMSRAQAAVVVALVALALVAPHFIFRGQHIGAATRPVQVLNEEGRPVTAEVPRADLVRSVLFMPPALDAKSPAWLAAAVPDALAIDLGQNPFLRAENGLERLAGRMTPGEDMGRLSLARYQEAARDINADYFVTGQAEGTAEALRLDLIVYRTDPLQEVGRTSVAGPLLTAIDAAKPGLRNLFDLKAQRAAGDVDAPVASLLSSDIEALKAMYESDLTLLRQEGVNKVRAQIERALVRDPALASAGLRLYAVGYLGADTGTMQRGLEIAYRNRDRIAEEPRCIVRTLHTLYAGQREAALRVARGCTELYPAYADGVRQYAQLLTETGSFAEAIKQLQRLRAVDRANDDALLQLGELQLRTDDAAGARESFGAYLKLRPVNTEAVLGMAEALVRSNRWAEAINLLEDGIAKRDRAPELVQRLASYRLDEGDDAAARALVEPLLKSNIASERALGMRLVERGQRGNGQLRAARSTAAEQIKAEGRPNTPVEVLLPLLRYPELERETLPAMLGRISRVQGGEDPFTRFQIASLRLVVTIMLGNGSELAQERQANEKGTQNFAFIARNALLALAEARQATREQRYAEADAVYARAIELLRQSRGGAFLVESEAMVWRVESAITGGDTKTAQRALGELVVLKPGAPMARLLQAELAVAQGDAAAAAAPLQRALDAWSKADPEFGPAQRARALERSLRKAG